MDFLKAALDAIPAAASTPLALAAYVVAIAAWVVISVRVWRNRNLLRNLDRLPEHDRLAALQAEMGNLPLRSGLTPQQFLRSQIHRYYFYAFLVVSLLGFLIVAVAAATRTTGQSTTLVLSSTVSEESVEQSFDFIDLGEQKSFVESKLGLPQIYLNAEHAQVGCYEFHKFGLVTAYEDKTLAFYEIIQFTEEFDPGEMFEPTLHLDSDFLVVPALGKFTFDDVTSDDLVPTQVSVFEGASGGFYYEEEYPRGKFGNDDTDYVFAFKGHSDPVDLDTGQVLDPIFDLQQDLDGDTTKLSKEQRVYFQKWRSLAKPNTFAAAKHQRRSNLSTSLCDDFHTRHDGKRL